MKLYEWKSRMEVFMNSNKVDGKLIAWVYPKFPQPVLQLQWKQVSSENEDKDRLLQSVRCCNANCDSEVFRNVLCQKKFLTLAGLLQDF